MIVFKQYLKITKTFLAIIITYTAIFLGIAIAFTLNSGNNDATASFDAFETKIAIVNNDENTEFIRSFKEYIEDSAKLITLDSDEESLKDALFFRKVDYIMIIPENFTRDFLLGENPKIDVMSVPDSVAGIYSKELMNRYLNIANLYVRADISEEVLSERIKEDLSKIATVNLVSNDSSSELDSARYFYNSMNYVLMAGIIVIVALIMRSFTESKIKLRNLISATPYKKINQQLFFGSVVVSMGIWLLYIGASFVLYTDTMLSNYGLLFIINSAVFLTTILAIAILLATFINSREAISGISSVLSLGTSFIAGAFVPQEFLSSYVLVIARVTPSYWYITSNNKIIKLTNFNFEELSPILFNMLVIVGFTVICYLAIQLVTKLKLKK